MQAPANRSGRFNWNACNNNDLAEILATSLVSAGAPYTCAAYNMACLSKELSRAVKTAVGNELSNLQTLWEDQRKLSIRKKQGDNSPALVQSLCELTVDFRAAFIRFMGMSNATTFLAQIDKMLQLQEKARNQPVLPQHTIVNFWANFQDYALMAHMCTGKCMISDQLNGERAEKGDKAEPPKMELIFPFGHQMRLAFVDIHVFKRVTVACHPIMVGNPLMQALRREYNPRFNDLEWVQATRIAFGARIPANEARSRDPSMWIPILPSSFVALEDSFVGRLKMSNEQITLGINAAKRLKQQQKMEKHAVMEIRLRRFNYDATVCLKTNNIQMQWEEMFELLGTDVADEWCERAVALLEVYPALHPTEDMKMARMLSIIQTQLHMRALYKEVLGKELTRDETAWTTVELAPSLQRETKNIPSLKNKGHEWVDWDERGGAGAMHPIRLAVEHVASQLRSGRARFVVKRTHDNLVWSIDLGRGFVLKMPMFEEDEDGRVIHTRMNAFHIRDVFKACAEHSGATTPCLALPKLDRARSVLCRMSNKGPREKDHASLFLDSVDKLMSEMRGTIEGNTVGLKLFRIGKPQLKEALETLHDKWRCRQIPNLPAQCPVNQRGFTLALLGNPLNEHIAYVNRPPILLSKQEEKEQEEKLRLIREQLEEAQDSDFSEDPFLEDSPIVPQYNPTSPVYDFPGEEELYGNL
jgi:hypothetical protein